jgi:hypothetical protein
MILQKAECLRVLSRPEEGLRWLAKQFANDPRHWEQPAVCHDIFEQIPWTEIGTHWVHLYKDVWTFKPEFVCGIDNENEVVPFLNFLSCRTKLRWIF